MLRNPYKILRDLMPDPSLQVGDIVSAANGVATVQLPGGGLVQARGTIISGRVFVRDGAIEGAAPSLPIEVIEV